MKIDQFYVWLLVNFEGKCEEKKKKKKKRKSRGKK